MKKLYCKNCGNLIPANARFCPACSHKTDFSQLNTAKYVAVTLSIIAACEIAAAVGVYISTSQGPISFGGGSAAGGIGGNDPANVTVQTTTEENTVKNSTPQIESETKIKTESETNPPKKTTSKPTTRQTSKPKPKNTSCSESDMKSIAKQFGNIIAWEYHDYDNDGKKEAYATINEGSEKSVYFVNSNGNGLFMFDNSEVDYLDFYDDTYKFVSDGTHNFFVFDYGGYGSGWQSCVFAVDDGQPYELDISRKIQSLFYDKKYGFYTSETTHESGEMGLNFFVLNFSDGQFTKGKQIYIDENESYNSETEKETQTENNSTSWKDAYKEVVLSLTDPKWDGYYLYDMNNDSIPELIVAEYHNIYIYSYKNKEAMLVGNFEVMEAHMMIDNDKNQLCYDWQHAAGENHTWDGGVIWLSFDGNSVDEEDYVYTYEDINGNVSYPDINTTDLTMYDPMDTSGIDNY